MNVRAGQSGVTMWGMLVIAFLVVFFALLLFMLLPPYLEDLKVSGALSSVERQAEGTTMSNPEIMEALRKRFDIDDVTHVNLRDVRIERRGNFKVIKIEYERVVPLAFNISALLEFNHSVEVAAFE